MTSAEQEVDRLLTVCLEEIAKAKKEAFGQAAALCREAGCICDRLPWSEFRKPNTHDSRCPADLAARIEALGGGKEE